MYMKRGYSNNKEWNCCGGDPRNRDRRLFPMVKGVEGDMMQALVAERHAIEEMMGPIKNGKETLCGTPHGQDDLIGTIWVRAGVVHVSYT
jgi:hypothetical protein